jgi:long-subunit fatty acid transport protein
MTVRETFLEEGTSRFDNGDSYVYPAGSSTPFKTEYDIETPYVFSAGLSGSFQNLTLSGDVEYTDWTQMEFRNADSYLMGINTDVKEIYQPTVNLHAGAEYMFPYSDFRLRAGFAYLPSPYSGDPGSFAQKFVTGGVGLVVEDAIMIDVAYAYGFWESFRYNYDATSKVKEDITTHNLFATVSYRF